MTRSGESTSGAAKKSPVALPPKRTLFTLASIAAILFLAEFAIMAALPLFGLDGLAESAVDSFLLAILALPALYAIGFRSPSPAELKQVGRYSGAERRTTILLLLQVAMIMVVVTVYAVLLAERNVGLQVVDLAGSQRALSQRIVQNAMRESMESAHERLHGRTADAIDPQNVAVTRFERNRRALSEGDVELGIPACESHEAAAQLAVAAESWLRLRTLAESSSLPRTMDDAKTYFQELQREGYRVHTEVDRAATLLAGHYSGGEQGLRVVLGAAIVLSVATCLLLATTCFQMMRDRRQSDEALRSSEAKYRDLIDAANDVIVSVDANGNIKDINPQGSLLTGYTQDTLLGMNVMQDLIVPEDHERVRKVLRNLASGKSQVFDVRWRARDGHVIHFEVSSTPRMSAEGRFVSTRWALRDVTLRKCVEAQLRKLSLAVEQSPASILITDTQGLIEYVNPMFCEVTGYAAVEVIGQNPRILKSGNRPKEASKRLWDTILAGEIWTGAFENKKKTGELYWEEASISPIRDEDGTVTHFVAVKLDITERKHMEASLRKTESELRQHRDHLEELVSERTAELANTNDALVHEVEERRKAEKTAAAASSAKGEFLATMSHELRTPLNGVIGMMELLLRSNLDPKQQRHAWLAKSSGDTLLSLINDILDFSKIESGRLELEETDFDLRNTLESLGASLVSRAESKGLELSCSVHPHVQTLVTGDPGRLQQILMNLTVNAIKFTERGKVTVRATTDDETEEVVTLRFTVTDTGIGIPLDRRERLFQSFSQVDASTTRKYGGTGLGLAISKQLSELMGGEIGVESEPGRGSTFWFTVKLKRRTSGDSGRHELDNSCRYLRILAVDDNPTNRKTIAEQLSGLGLKNDTARNGKEALAKLREAAENGAPFGLAILDMRMPRMDGEQLAEAITADPLLERTVLLLLTSGGPGDDTDRLHSLGFSGWLTKPISQSKLLNAVVEAIASANLAPRSQEQGLLEGSSRKKHAEKPGESGARILLVEDNEISTEAAMELLSQAGYDCDPVANGRQAVQAVLDGKYDLVLMDCQMPEMDGFEATRTIRRHEKDGTLSTGKTGKIPIIALTANAIKGDRERCLESGMDDYLTKPLDPERLVAVIETHLKPVGKGSHPSLVDATNEPPPKSEPAGGSANPVALGASAPFDLEAVYKRWGANKGFAEKLITKFLRQAPGDVEQLEQAVAEGDVGEATRFAHGLKGAASYVSADALRAVAARLEAMGRAGEMNDADELISELRNELERCLGFDLKRHDAAEPIHANLDR